MFQLETSKSRLKRCVAIYIILVCLISIPMVSYAGGFGITEARKNTAYTRALSDYSGVFSTCVSSSVNPTATLAVLSIFGAFENVAEYSSSMVLNDIADYLNEIPVIKEASKMPVANPVAAIILTLAAIALTAMHFLKVTEAIRSYIKIDVVERVIQNLQNLVLSILPLITTEALISGSAGTKGGAIVVKAIDVLGKANTQGPNWFTYVMAIITFVGLTFSTNISFSCFKNTDVIAAGVPVAGSSVAWQVIKMIIQILILILQTYAPGVCVFFCINLVIASFFLFRLLKRNAIYYTDIYLMTIIHRIFRRKRPVSRIEKLVPRRLKKLYPEMEIGMAVYTFHGYARLAKRSRVWLIKEGEKLELVYKRLIRKPVVITWADMREKHENKTVYLEQCLRFLRIRTEDKKIELVISNRYKPEIEMLSELLDLKDYEIVKKENKETKKLKKLERKMRRKRKREKNVAEPVT